jgi:hypothetical protein
MVAPGINDNRSIHLVTAFNLGITNPCQFRGNGGKTPHSKKSITIFTVPDY